MQVSDYNKRLFSRGLRRKFHLARFEWLRSVIQKYKLDTSHVVELGCFDGRSIGYISPPPAKYIGFDANWENGLDIAKTKYSTLQNYSFNECDNPDNFILSKEIYTLAISLETLEHIPVELLDGYLDKISNSLDGHLIVTVPNEKGVVFLVKYLLKRFIYGGCDRYTLKEILDATLGRMHHVERDQHKGFDYIDLKNILLERFDLVVEQGIPFSFLPLQLNTQIGFLMKSKK